MTTDGSSLGNPGRTDGGGLIRDQNDNWVIGFSRNIGIAIGVDAELWALKDGLTICRELNLSAVEIEIDAKVAPGWVSDTYNYNLHHAALILDCRTLISQIPQVRMNYYFREANKCTNALARRGSELDQDVIVFDSLTMDIVMLLYNDKLGMYYERLCPLTFADVA